MKELRSTGLSPDFLICRTASPLERVCVYCITIMNRKPKRRLLLSVGNVLSVHDVSNIYHVPLVLREQQAAENILKLLELPCGESNMSKWEVDRRFI